MSSKKAEQFAELLKEQIGHPTTRARLDINIFLANYLDVDSHEMCALLGTAFLSYTKMVCKEGREEEVINDITGWARDIILGEEHPIDGKGTNADNVIPFGKHLN